MVDPLTAALDWHHKRLSERERRLFRRTAIFGEGFDLAAAAAVCAGRDLPRSDVASVLSALVERSLVEVAGDRYRLLEAVRRYALALLRASGEEAALARHHAAHYAGLARATGRVGHRLDETGWLRRLDLEHGNLRAALGWCRDHDAAAWLQLAADLGWFWMARGHLAEGREWLEGALAANGEPSSERARALWAIARLSHLRGDVAEARRLGEESLLVSRCVGDVGAAGWALAVLGLTAAANGEPDAGLRWYEEALSVAGDAELRADALVGIGECLLMTGRPVEARARLAEVLARGQLRGRVSTLLALCSLMLGDREGARAHAGRALDAFVEVDNPIGVAACLSAIATQVVGAQPERALCLCGAAEGLRRPNGAALSQHWREVLHAVVIAPASELLGQRVTAIWARGERMTLDEAVACAREGLARAAGARPHGLSPRQMAVAELIAAGLTNRAIAERLGITERTVEGHVERLMDRLDVRSRTQVAVAVVERRASLMP